MLIGFARTSTGEQTRVLQTDALKEAGCAQADRPSVAEALDHIRPGDTLVV